MADASNTMRYLMKEFDTAPAGTREEALMAKELSETIHLHGLQTINQDFNYPSHGKTIFGVTMLIAALMGIVGGVGSGALTVVALIIAILAGVLYGLEQSDIHLLSFIGRPGCSQNLIARHPAASSAGGSKERPIVVIAHYDTPRADFMATPLLRRFIPYVDGAATIAMGVEVVALLVQVIPFPSVVQSIALALSIIATVVLVFCAARIILSRYVMPYTRGANDNMAGVSALLGLLYRVRPAMDADMVPSDDEEYPDAYNSSVGEISESDVPAVEGRRSRRSSDSPEQRSRGARRSRRASLAPVRRGAEVLRSLGMVPEGCEIVYEQAPAAAPASSSSQSAPVTASQSGVAAAVEDAPAARPAERVASFEGTGSASPVSSRAERVAARGVSEPVQASPAAQPARDAGATMVLTHEQLRAVQAREAAEKERAAAQAAQEAADAGATVMMTAADQRAMASDGTESQAQEAAASAFDRPLEVITWRDEPDAELRQSSVSLPKDVAQQQGALLDDDELRRDSILNSPTWGTTSFSPVRQNRLVLEDVPDPAVAAVDPYSVSSIETIGDYNPEDFSAMDFESGTHSSLTPVMIEEYKRRNLDGFADFTSPDSGSQKARRNKRKNRSGATGRISHRAAEMAKQMEEESFSDWLGVDENYDAQKNGRQMGSWSNFNDDAQAAPAAQPQQVAQGAAGTSTMPRIGDDEPDADGFYPESTVSSDEDSDRYPRWQGGAASARRRSARANSDQDEQDLRQAAMVLGDRDLISHEIWFVFTGASEAQHAGMRAFLDEYNKKLRGAYFINLECVGAGRQSLVLEEGRAPKSRKADRRLVNLFGEASQAINRPLALTRMPWRDTEATIAMRQGFRAVTVCGVEDGAPANARWTGDAPETIKPAMIDDIVDIMVEVIKHS